MCDRYTSTYDEDELDEEADEPHNGKSDDSLEADLLVLCEMKERREREKKSDDVFVSKATRERSGLGQARPNRTQSLG